MESRKLSLRQRLLGGETVYGLVIKAPAPALVEMCAAAGFDFAFIDGEHGGAEAQEIEHHVRAGESFGMPSVSNQIGHFFMPHRRETRQRELLAPCGIIWTTA